MLGAEQRAWLVDAVSDPAPRWVLLASGTVLSELTIDAPDSLDGVLPEKYAVVDGRATNTDQWDGYLAEREQLAAALGQRAGGNLVVSGDIQIGRASGRERGCQYVSNSVVAVTLK